MNYLQDAQRTLADQMLAHVNPHLFSLARMTPKKTTYLKHPGVALIAHTKTDVKNALDMLALYHIKHEDDGKFIPGVMDYNRPPENITDGSTLVQFAGQLCYLSFGSERTPLANNRQYVENILQQAHGSVLEHWNASFLLYGISRSLTHELVRHRSGMAYSQVSQRYVDGGSLRFVQRPEFKGGDAENSFFDVIDTAALNYEHTAEYLMLHQQEELAALSRRDRRKSVNQTARYCLPNCTEAPLVATGNGRAWRHVLEQRGSKPAEREIRSLAWRICLILQAIEPNLFQDYKIIEIGENDWGLENTYRKV